MCYGVTIWRGTSIPSFLIKPLGLLLVTAVDWESEIDFWNILFPLGISLLLLKCYWVGYESEEEKKHNQ